MKPYRTFILLALSIGLLSGATSCVVVTPKDNGNHSGYYKNSNNPHNPNHQSQGKSHEKHNK